ncbi:hypothetical protein M011DRAFT_474738 [Sporormia fimetaria CBS 119925]|uniref:Uncharacterized protein n=1 Tax=Sporormia fimetaria CBS 119925 TaxID=1340428 RepID=A0A6A6VI28_9PLEO|nr:hypothetical protein M011DRAFT_474738 [Sporormia fimetaria CBS 119925]
MSPEKQSPTDAIDSLLQTIDTAISIMDKLCPEGTTRELPADTDASALFQLMRSIEGENDTLSRHYRNVLGSFILLYLTPVPQFRRERKETLVKDLRKLKDAYHFLDLFTHSEARDLGNRLGPEGYRKKDLFDWRGKIRDLEVKLKEKGLLEEGWEDGGE